MPAKKIEVPDEIVVAVASAVAEALGGDLSEPPIAERPTVEPRDEDDGTNEYIRLNILGKT